MSKQFIGVIVAIIVVFVGIFALTGNKSSNSSSKSSNSNELTNHVEGSGSSGVTLVEYGDYQCPYCQQYYATVKSVTDEFKDQIRFQFRNFPLINAHQNAFAAARAAEAAGMQNKYWEMHDLLYENNDPTGQSGWVASGNASSYFNQYAQQLGLDMTKFKADYASSKVNDLINADMAEGNRLGVTGTPTFFLDGKQVQLANDKTAFEKAIKAEIAKKQPASGAASSSSSSTAQNQ